MSTLELAEWQRHVRQEGAKLTLCGVPILFGEWTFVSADHARTANASGKRVQPCPVCWAEILKRG